MNRKTARRLLRIISRVPGLYSLAAFFAARRVTVRGASMRPLLHDGDRVLFDRLAYVRERPRRGDVVLVQHPWKPVRMVKRLTGLPGDTIDGVHGPYHLGRRQYWVTGDNPDESTDSRTWGPVSRGHLLARASVRYWPAERWKVLS